MAKFNISFPVEFGVSGGLQLTSDPLFPRMRAMFSFVPGQRLLRADYGIDMSPIEQSTHDANDIISAVLIKARETISRYLLEYAVVGISVDRDTSSRRMITVSIVIQKISSSTLQVATIELPTVV